MKISEASATVLKNFSQINPSILLKTGSTISTISPQKTVIGTAVVDESFPVEGAIYDLNRFLGVLSLFEEPELSFTPQKVTISEGSRAINYTFAEASMVIAPPEKKIDFPAPEVSVEVSWTEMQSVLRAASVMSLPEIAFNGSDGKVSLAAVDSKNPTADTYSSELGDTNRTFNFIFKVENLKLLNLNYNVSISKRGIAKFVSTNTYGAQMEYLIATEANSTCED